MVCSKPLECYGGSPYSDDRIHGGVFSFYYDRLHGEHFSIRQTRCDVPLGQLDDLSDQQSRNPVEMYLQSFYRVEILMNNFFALSEFLIFGESALTMQKSLLRQITVRHSRSASTGLLPFAAQGPFFRLLFSSDGENRVCFSFSHYSAEMFSSCTKTPIVDDVIKKGLSYTILFGILAKILIKYNEMMMEKQT